MATIARVPITNVYMGGDYTASILVGPNKKPMNVILDTGSSALALDGAKYKPDVAEGDKTTDLAQADSYGDHSGWIGAVIKTTISIGVGATQVTLPLGNAAIAYAESANMFRGADGILGLAYAPLDDAFTMPGDSWLNKYPQVQIQQGTRTTIVPYLQQLTDAGVVSDIISFLTRRSFVHEGGGGVADPLNQGWAVVGGGVEATDLYTGAFEGAAVLTDEWWNTNLKQVIVAGAPAIPVKPRPAKGMPSNSIVDSGTNSLNLGPSLLRSISNRLTPTQRAQLQSSMAGNLVPMADLDLASWPTISFVLQGETADVTLDVAPGDYWQVNTGQVGQAMAAITRGENGFAILGLPLMNGYFTVFDGEAANGRGVIRFAKAVR